MAIQDSVVTYNGITFPVGHRLDVVQQAVYAEDHATQYAVAYTFTVSGVLTADTETALATLLNSFRNALMVPRMNLDILWRGTTFFGGGSDWLKANEILWGPQPDEIRFTNFLGGRAVFYTWSIRALVKDCWSCAGGNCNSFARPSEIVALVYRYGSQIDPNGFTTFTTSGRLIVSSSSAANRLPADAYRLLVTPPVPKWFRRLGQTFDQSEDGTILDFSFTDVEQNWMLPRPVTNGSASYTIRASQFGFRFDYSLSGHFEAPATVTKATLVQRVYELAVSRFPLNQQNIPLFPVSLELKEDIYGSNSIDFNIQYWSAGGTGAVGPVGWSMAGSTFGLAPPMENGGQQDGTGYIPFAYGQDGIITSGVIAAPPYLFDACHPPSGAVVPVVNQLPQTSLSEPQGQNQAKTDPYANVKSLSGKNYADQYVSPDHLQAPYYAFSETISYELDSGVVALAPKKAGKGVFVQQTRTPTLRIIQAGYAVRDGRRPNPPARLYDPAVAVLLPGFYVTTDTPEPIGDGQYNRYTMRWRVVYQFLPAVTTIAQLNQDGVLMFPPDPRRQAGQQPPKEAGDASTVPALPFVLPGEPLPNQKQ